MSDAPPNVDIMIQSKTNEPEFKMAIIRRKKYSGSQDIVDDLWHNTSKKFAELALVSISVETGKLWTPVSTSRHGHDKILFHCGHSIIALSIWLSKC